MKLSVLVGTYNEQDRLPYFLKHATQWADEVVVVDKGSMDETVRIAENYGARVIHAPFTRQGHEDIVENIKRPTHDWVFVMTPGEVPTRELISTVKALLATHGDLVDIITIPKKLYSFGIHDPRSPWSIGQQPVLVNRKWARISNCVHRNFTLASGRQAINIPYSETCHVYHPTHATAESFLRSHCDYILAEAKGCENPTQLIHEALSNFSNYDFGNHDPALFIQECAWKFYWLGCAMAAAELKSGRNVTMEYETKTAEMLEKEWGLT